MYPERYRVAVTMTPADPSSLGLSGALGQLGAFNSVFSNQASLELTLRVARGSDVRQMLIKRLNLVKTMGFHTEKQADVWLTKNLSVNIRSLRGGIIQMEAYQKDPIFGLKLINALADATRERLALINRQQTEYKRDVLLALVRDSGEKLEVAQNNYDRFRLSTRYSEPKFAISAIGERIPAIQAIIKSKEVQLNAARKFATEDNISVGQILAELEALRGQLREAMRLNPNSADSVGRVVKESTTVRKLERELNVARSLYDGYTRYLDGTAVEDLTSTANLRILEPPFIDSARQYNSLPLGLALLIIAIGLATEFYLFRQPVGEK
jgi:tyrosine-protein kinase Etk/Wzc